MLCAPFFLASRSAASVSAVSPDCVMTIASVLRGDDRIAIAILRAVVDVDRHPRQRLDQELADERGVPRRSARQDHDPLDVAQNLIRNLDLLQEYLPALDGRPAQHGLFHRPRLLEDLLQHEVLVSGLLRHDRIPRHPRALLRHRAARVVRKLHAVRRDDGHLLVAEKHDVAGVAQHRGNIGCHEELAIPEADDDGRTVSNGHDLVRVFRRDQHQREEPAHVEQRAPHGILETVVFHLAFDQMRDDFGIGFGDELVSLFLKLTFQIEVVLDDAVVDHNDASGTVTVRMGVLLCWTAVCGPSRVADAGTRRRAGCER